MWNITENVLKLNQQGWKNYTGAWGEVGARADTTGPLGPWLKRWDSGTQIDTFIVLKQLISENEVLIMPDIRYESDQIVESEGTAFVSPADMLITGRRHEGDEKGNTIYEYASLKAIDCFGNEVDGLITISNLEWSETHKESDSADFFYAPSGRVITGRQHFDDENGKTRYQTGVVYFNGKPATVLSAPSSLPQVEFCESTSIFFKSASRFVIIGRTHVGDENGNTIYYQGYIKIQM